MKRAAFLFQIWLGGAPLGAAEELPLPAELSGGKTTVFDASEESFGMVLANATVETRRYFNVGNAFFMAPWQVAPAPAALRDGLGPLYHARSCFDCHFRDGRGEYPLKDDPLESVLIRVSVPGLDAHGGPRPDPIYGGQLATQAISGVKPEISAEVTWKLIDGKFPDGEPYQLRQPQLSISRWNYGPPADHHAYSIRIAQAIHGLGLLEAVPEAQLLEFSDPEDLNKDGISGRPNYVWNTEKQERALGRFGWKANVADLRQQTAMAFLGDQGIRSPVFPSGDLTASQAQKLEKFPAGGEPEISETLLARVVTYVRALATPARREVQDTQVLRGEAVFRELKCAQCHRETLVTTSSPELRELEGQTIHPYTDLLLHDLGEGLADGRGDFLATGVEWRTPPLWGLGLNEMVNGHVNFLHDGRARTLTESILWHEGESAASSAAFRALGKSDREALLRFLNSL